MTFKSLSVILLISASAFIASIQAQNCSNPLLGTFSIPGLSTARPAAALPYCTDLRAGQSCCSNATVRNLQNNLNNLTTRLQDAAGSRDQFIAGLRDNYLNQFQDLEDVLSDLSDEILNLRSVNTTVGNQVISQRDQMNVIAEELSDLDDNFQGALEDYQRSRVACFDTVLKVQASAWCLACDPDFSSKGVLSNGTVVFSDNLCNTITQACYPFLETTNRNNPLFRARQAFQRLQNLITYVNDFATTGIVPNRSLQGDVFSSENANERTVTIPPGCDDVNNCPWQCQNLFSGLGVMNEEIVANGAGVIGGADVVLDPIGGTAPARMLQDGTGPTLSNWNPNLETTGFAFNVLADPARVTGLEGDGTIVRPSGGLRIGGILGGLMVLAVGLVY